MCSKMEPLYHDLTNYYTNCSRRTIGKCKDGFLNTELSFIIKVVVAGGLQLICLAVCFCGSRICELPSKL